MEATASHADDAGESDVLAPGLVDRRFPAILGTIAGLAVAVRLAFVLGFEFWSVPELSDETWFHDVAANLAAGRGFVWIEPGSGQPDQYLPTAWHPPGFAILHAGFDVIGIDSRTGHRVLMSLLAAVGIIFVGLVGRRLACAAVGLVAASIAAVHPLWLIPVGVLSSESLVLVLVPIFLYVCLRCIDCPTIPWFVGLGALIGVMALTRSEALALAVIAGVPVAVLAAPRTARALKLVGALALTALVVVTPWMIRNQARFGAPNLSTNLGITVSGTYCDEAFRFGSNYGSSVFECGYAARLDEYGHLDWVPPRQAAEGDRTFTRNAVEYAADHVIELPGVMGARVARMLGLWEQWPDSLTIGVVFWPRSGDLPEAWLQSRPGLEQAGVYFNWVLLALAVVGAATIPRDARRRWIPVLIPIALAVLVAMFVQGTMRTRTVAEPSLALFAAFGLVALWSRRRRRTRAA